MRDAENERGGPGWGVTLLGASVLVVAGFAVGVVVGAAREEPGLILEHFAGGTESVAPSAGTPGVAPGAPPIADPAAAPSPAPSMPAAAPTPTVQLAPPSAPAALAPRAAVASAPPPLVAVDPEEPLGDEPAPARGPSRRGAKPVASAPPLAGGPYSIQVGAFADSAQAEKLAKDLKRRGFAVVVSPGTGDRSSRWRVRVGPLATREEADRAADRLRAQKLDTWVLDEAR